MAAETDPAQRYIMESLALLEAVKALHQGIRGTLCTECRVMWPCPTYRAATEQVASREAEQGRTE